MSEKKEENVTIDIRQHIHPSTNPIFSGLLYRTRCRCFIIVTDIARKRILIHGDLKRR